jgi:plasmid segregation protein ParM
MAGLVPRENRQNNNTDCANHVRSWSHIGYTNLKLAFGEVQATGGPQPAVTRVLPAGAGRLSDLPLRMGKAEGDTDALVVNVNGEKWVAGVDQARLETSVRELHADYPASDAYRALFHGTLLLSEQDTVNRLITGLLISQYLD